MIKITLSSILTQWCPGRYCILVDPEWDPGEDNNQGAGDVGLNGEVAHSPAQVKEDGQHHIVSWRKINNRRREEEKRWGHRGGTIHEGYKVYTVWTLFEGVCTRLIWHDFLLLLVFYYFYWSAVGLSDYFVSILLFNGFSSRVLLTFTRLLLVLIIIIINYYFIFQFLLVVFKWHVLDVG